jgi:hypothetical protein
MLPLLLLFAVASASGSGFCFPGDPADEQVIDRAYECSGWDEDLLYIYAILFDRGGQASVDVMIGNCGMDGVEWEHVYTWDITFMGEPVEIPGVAVIDIWSDDVDRAVFYYEDDVMIGEGLATLFLELDLETLEFTEKWVD